MGAPHEGRTKIIILTASYRIKGYIDLLPGSRVTDYIVGAKDFIAVTQAEVWGVNGGGLVLSAQFVDVSRDQIQVITTSDTQQPIASVTGDSTVTAIL